MSDEEVVEKFLHEICELFPEVKERMDSHDEYMTTFKMEEFANATTLAFASDQIEVAKKYLSYMNHKLANAHPKEFEFIDVYYVENLFWNAAPETKQKGWPLVPPKLQELYVKFHGKPAL